MLRLRLLVMSICSVLSLTLMSPVQARIDIGINVGGPSIIYPGPLQTDCYIAPGAWYVDGYGESQWMPAHQMCQPMPGPYYSSPYYNQGYGPYSGGWSRGWAGHGWHGGGHYWRH